MTIQTAIEEVLMIQYTAMVYVMGGVDVYQDNTRGTSTCFNMQSCERVFDKDTPVCAQ
jgi:hypothetical protein